MQAFVPKTTLAPISLRSPESQWFSLYQAGVGLPSQPAGGFGASEGKGLGAAGRPALWPCTLTSVPTCLFSA